MAKMKNTPSIKNPISSKLRTMIVIIIEIDNFTTLVVDECAVVGGGGVGDPDVIK